MNQRMTVLIFNLVLLVLFVSSCSRYEAIFAVYALKESVQYEDVKIPEKYKEKFSSCRGFDFDRSFSGKGGARAYGFFYSISLEKVNHMDGFGYYFSREGKPDISVYHKDAKHTPKEKKYFAAYKKREEEFDRKYGGDIKRKMSRMEKVLRHPLAYKESLASIRYLEGDKLPEGLFSPASIFVRIFFSKYLLAEGRANALQRFIMSVKWYKGLELGYYADMIGRDAAGSASNRLEALYVDYVLTYYLLKEYATSKERHRVATDLADYYSNVAFRGAAESLYEYRNILNSGQRCKVANFIAARVYDLVMVIDDPLRLQQIKREYKEELTEVCKGSIVSSVYDNTDYEDLFISGAITRKERNIRYRELRQTIYNAVDNGELRCIND